MAVERIDPPYAGTEKETLLGFADFLRQTILLKLEGLDDEQARRPHHPSGLTLLGMVKHLAYVERFWFQRVFMGEEVEIIWSEGDPDADWRIDPDETTAGIIALYREQVTISNRIAAAHDPDATARRPGPSRQGLQLRWILTHMIEETARHAGHADVIREAIDGQTGE